MKKLFYSRSAANREIDYLWLQLRISAEKLTETELKLQVTERKLADVRKALGV